MIEKISLNRVTYAVRAAQAVLQYGVGAMVDFQDQTLMTSAPEYWNKTQRIDDERFAKALGVDYFCLPVDISYARFPEWYFCPKCRKFQTISEWLNEHRQKANEKTKRDDEYMVRHLQCQNCHQDLVVARIVTICEKGHINDFPWVEWVHRNSEEAVCSHPKLKFKTGASGTEGLEGLNISCDTCGAHTTLKGAFDKEIFSELDEKLGKTSFLCQGNHPQKHEKEDCVCYPRTVQRGSSSVYFPVVYSSLVIPPYADKLNELIEKSSAFDHCLIIINDEEQENRIKKINERLNKWSNEIAKEISADKDEVQRILTRKWLEPADSDADVSNIKYRAEEYAALTGEVKVSNSLSEFSRESISIDRYKIPFLKSISLIDKIRVVNALVGFSRNKPVMSENDDGFASVKEKKTRWFPAYEVRGEGIFVEFQQQDINDWILNNPQVFERAEKINKNYSRSFTGKSNPREITPKFILLHTLSHLLINQLSFECGYNIASLSERIYCAEKIDGKEMSGIFIYTASGDSEGTLGGLVRQGRSDVFPHTFKKAIAEARICSNDPVCILSQGSGRESLNLAACHSCALLPETCCEERNAFLDRGMVVGGYGEDDFGFYKTLLKGLGY